MTLRTTEEELRELGLLDMLDSGGVSDEELEALVHQRRAERAQLSKLPLADSSLIVAPPTPLIVTPDSPRDRDFRDKVAVAVITEPGGDASKAIERLGISWDIYRQVIDHPDYNARFDELTEAMIVRPRKAAAKASVMDKAIADGNGYNLKVIHDTRFHETLGSEDAAYIESFAGAPKRTLLKEARRLQTEIKALVESLEGGKAPDDATTSEHRAAVSTRGKKKAKVK